jgi:hypothetical protein
MRSSISWTSPSFAAWSMMACMLPAVGSNP